MTTKCPFSDCKSENYKTVKVVRDKGFRNKFQYYILECLDCGAEYHDYAKELLK